MITPQSALSARHEVREVAPELSELTETVVRAPGEAWS